MKGIRFSSVAGARRQIYGEAAVPMKDLNSLLMEYLKPAIGGSNDLNPDSPDLENIISIIEKDGIIEY